MGYCDCRCQFLNIWWYKTYCDIFERFIFKVWCVVVLSSGSGSSWKGISPNLTMIRNVSWFLVTGRVTLWKLVHIVWLKHIYINFRFSLREQGWPLTPYMCRVQYIGSNGLFTLNLYFDCSLYISFYFLMDYLIYHLRFIWTVLLHCSFQKL